MSCVKKEDAGHNSYKDLNASLDAGQLCGSSYSDVPITVKLWTDLMTEMLIDLCGVLFDGMTCFIGSLYTQHIFTISLRNNMGSMGFTKSPISMMLSWKMVKAVMLAQHQ